MSNKRLIYLHLLHFKNEYSFATGFIVSFVEIRSHLDVNDIKENRYNFPVLLVLD